MSDNYFAKRWVLGPFELFVYWGKDRFRVSFYAFSRQWAFEFAGSEPFDE